MTPTPARQPQYVISVKDAEEFDKFIDAMEHSGITAHDEAFAVMYAWRGMLSEAKATHTSPPAPEPTHQIIHNPDENERKECGGCEAESCSTVCIPWINEHDAAIAKAEREQFVKQMANLCAYLHYSHSENERMAKESKGIAREILKGRMFEDCQILEALEELRVNGKISLRAQQEP